MSCPALLRHLFLCLLALTLLPHAHAARIHAHAARHHAHKLRHTHAAAKAASPASAGIKVWVNLPSGVYHYPGARWYGRTQDGAYMSEAAARKAGYRSAENYQ